MTFFFGLVEDSVQCKSDVEFDGRQPSTAQTMEMDQ